MAHCETRLRLVGASPPPRPRSHRPLVTIRQPTGVAVLRHVGHYWHILVHSGSLVQYVVHWCSMWFTGTVCDSLVQYVIHWYSMWFTGTACGSLVQHVVHWYSMWSTGALYSSLVQYVVHWYSM